MELLEVAELLTPVGVLLDLSGPGPRRESEVLPPGSDAALFSAPGMTTEYAKRITFELWGASGCHSSGVDVSRSIPVLLGAPYGVAKRLREAQRTVEPTFAEPGDDEADSQPFHPLLDSSDRASLQALLQAAHETLADAGRCERGPSPGRARAKKIGKTFNFIFT